MQSQFNSTIYLLKPRTAYERSISDWSSDVCSSDLISVIAGLLLAIPLGIARSSRLWYVRALPYAYIFFFRGTPLLVQLFLVYYGLAQFDAVRSSALWPYLRDPFWCATATMSLHTAAYLAAILRGSIQAIPRGEVDAARAPGISHPKAFFS